VYRLPASITVESFKAITINSGIRLATFKHTQVVGAPVISRMKDLVTRKAFVLKISDNLPVKTAFTGEIVASRTCIAGQVLTAESPSLILPARLTAVQPDIEGRVLAWLPGLYDRMLPQQQKALRDSVKDRDEAGVWLRGAVLQNSFVVGDFYRYGRPCVYNKMASILRSL
jgi:hypothetical protein